MLAPDPSISRLAHDASCNKRRLAPELKHHVCDVTLRKLFKHHTGHGYLNYVHCRVT